MRHNTVCVLKDRFSLSIHASDLWCKCPPLSACFIEFNQEREEKNPPFNDFSSFFLLQAGVKGKLGRLLGVFEVSLQRITDMNELIH